MFLVKHLLYLGYEYNKRHWICNMMRTYCHLLARVATFILTRNWLAVWDIWLQTYNAAQSLESFLCSFPVQPGVSIYKCFSLKQWERDKARRKLGVRERERGLGVGKRGHLRSTLLVKILNALTCVSRMQRHSSTPWLQHPTPNKLSSLWAACYSQCEFPNGHNGGQDHLLLLGGEVCIQLQLRRKTSWCL